MSLTLRDKIAGALYGYAIGDALGIGTEFMSKAEAHFRYPDGLRHYSQIYRDSHRCQFRPGEWSLDTEIVLLLIDNITSHGHPDSRHYARQLKELYSKTPLDLEGHLRWIVEQDDYTDNPHAVCFRVWNAMGRYEAPNEALGRALTIALLPYADTDMVQDNVQLTHWDPRCLSSALIIAKVAHSLLYHGKEPDYDLLVRICHEIDERTLPYLEKSRSGDLDGLDLDDESTYWYTRKAMGAALWALWHTSSPSEALYTIIDEAGDADTNASLALGLLGLKYGYDALPRTEIEGLLSGARVGKAVDALVEHIGQHQK